MNNLDPLSKAMLQNAGVLPFASGPIPAGAVQLDAAKIPVLTAIDVTAIGELGQGETYYLVPDGKEWGSLGFDYNVLGATVLGTRNPASGAFSPLTGAKVVMRTKDRVVFDLCTRGDGSTTPLPPGFFMLQRGRHMRLEVTSPVHEGVVALVMLHGVRTE